MVFQRPAMNGLAGLAGSRCCLVAGAAAARRCADTTVRIRSEAWTAADERGYGEFIAAIGA